MSRFITILQETLEDSDQIDPDISKAYRTMEYPELIRFIQKVQGCDEESAISYYLKLKRSKE